MRIRQDAIAASVSISVSIALAAIALGRFAPAIARYGPD
jgi:hypothetical protein